MSGHSPGRSAPTTSGPWSLGRAVGGLATTGSAMIGSGLVVVVVLTALLTAAVGVDPAGAVIDDPDIDTTADYRYRVDPEAGQVEVTIDLTVTADKANTTTSTGYFQYFFDGTFLAIPAEVGDLQVTDGAGRSLEFDIDDTVPDVLQLFVEFRSNLFYRQTTEVVITFTLLGGQARGEELTRVNGAYAGFQAWVDPRLEEASLSVITPIGFVDRSTGSEPFTPGQRRAGADGDELWFVADDVDPEFQWASVSLARDDALITTDFEVDLDGAPDADPEFDVLAWPGDQVWTDFVTDNLETGLPLLSDEVGLPWPIDGELTIIESYDPYLNGYAGWYDVLAEEIEIGDELDTHVMFHELSHVWFNSGLFDERWITEGLADAFGAEVVETLGEDRPRPPTTRTSDSSAIALNQWSVLSEDVDVEQWAYGASWTVTEAMAEVVGLDVLAAAARAAAEDQIAYAGDGEPETMVRTSDWRLYLDLIENRGEVEGDEIVELFESWIVGQDQLDDLGVRATSRSRYAELDRAGDAWAPPLAVRRALSRWNFDDADELMVDAERMLDRRADTVEVIDQLVPALPEGSTVAIPDDLERAYEDAEAEDDLAEAGDLADRALAVANQLLATGEAVDGATGALQRVGAIGADHRDELAVAAARFTGGDLEGAAAAADRIDADVDDLSSQGLTRVGAALAALVAIGLALLWWRRRRVRRRSTPSSSTEPAEPAELASGPELNGITDDPAGGQPLRELALESTIGGIGVDVDDRPIPVISLARFAERRSEITDHLWRAATDVGFFQLTDHGVRAELIDRSFGAAEAFFALPDEVKAAHPWRRELNAGWESKTQVRPSTRVADQKESYQVTRPNMDGLWPPDAVLPGFRSTMVEIEGAAWRVAMDVLSCFADRLGFDRDFFTAAHDPAGEGYQSTVRLLHYFPMTGDDFEGGQWRAGAHTDYDCLTLLFQRAGQSGLQVCPGEDATSGRWTSVATDEDRITCNIGDMLMRWSDDQLRSTLHRVRGPEAGQSAPSRHSLAFFAQANKPALIESPSGSFESITAEDFLQQRIAANFAS